MAEFIDYLTLAADALEAFVVEQGADPFGVGELAAEYRVKILTLQAKMADGEI